jgi:hypothetical protein
VGSQQSWARHCSLPAVPSSRDAPGSWHTSASSSGPCMGHTESSGAKQDNSN